MNVLFDPNPYCFGSTSTMRAILAALPDASARVLATGSVHDLCGDLAVEPLDVRDVAALRARLDLLRWADVYVAVSNNTNVHTVCDAGVPLVFVDVLFRMKRGPTSAMRRASAYLIENYPGVSERLAELPIPHAQRIGPILSEPTGGPSPDRPLLVNVGGASSPDLRPGDNTNYPQRVVDLADQIAARRRWDPVDVAMGMTAAHASVARSGERPVTFPHAAYLDRLGHAAVLLTAPGLNAPLEAFRAGGPVAWLPPQNLTQVFHLKAYIDAGLAPSGLGLDELCPGFSVDARASESLGTGRVLKALATLDDRAWQRVAALVDGQLRAPDLLQRALRSVIVATGITQVNRRGGTTLRTPPRELVQSDWLTENQGVQGSNLCVRRVAFAALQGFDELMWCGEDVDFMIRAAGGGLRYGASTLPTVFWHRHERPRITDPNPRHAHAHRTFLAAHGARMTAVQVSDYRARTKQRFGVDPGVVPGLVWVLGPPGAGKTTWATGHAGDADRVMDFTEVMPWLDGADLGVRTANRHLASAIRAVERQRQEGRRRLFVTPAYFDPEDLGPIQFFEHIVCIVPSAERWRDQLLRREGHVDPRHEDEHRRWPSRFGTGARAAQGTAT